VLDLLNDGVAVARTLAKTAVMPSLTSGDIRAAVQHPNGALGHGSLAQGPPTCLSLHQLVDPLVGDIQEVSCISHADSELVRQTGSASYPDSDASAISARMSGGSPETSSRTLSVDETSS